MIQLGVDNQFYMKVRILSNEEYIICVPWQYINLCFLNADVMGFIEN